MKLRYIHNTNTDNNSFFFFKLNEATRVSVVLVFDSNAYQTPDVMWHFLFLFFFPLKNCCVISTHWSYIIYIKDIFSINLWPF